MSKQLVITLPDGGGQLLVPDYAFDVENPATEVSMRDKGGSWRPVALFAHCGGEVLVESW